MKLLFLFLLFTDTLHLSRSEVEQRFLRENLSLMAQRMQISEAEARVEQEKRWPNPTLTIDQLNLTAPKGQEVVPPLWGSFGKNRQFGVELEQIIFTAKKKRKSIALAEREVQLAHLSFSELLWESKLQLRQKCTAAQSLREQISFQQSHLIEVENILQKMEAHVSTGRIPKKEVVRMRTYLLEQKQNLAELIAEESEIQLQLKIWLNTSSFLVITDPLIPDDLEVFEESERPDLAIKKGLADYQAQNLILRKSERMPDLQLKAQYDRNGNAMLNFFGLGVSMDLPLWDKKQGAIKEAEWAKKRSELEVEQMEWKVQKEKEVAFENLHKAKEFLDAFSADFRQEQKEWLENYQKHLLERNTTLLEFLDQAESSLKALQLYVKAKETVRLRWEEYRYVKGL
ncbi:TolC family protein [Leadbetterella byssophila]|uniref:TolC family protein n=1 Tax=Leadbetterella byssophila TaxID=316068 RepID=UPI0039A00378